MVHAETGLSKAEVRHVYLRGAAALRGTWRSEQPMTRGDGDPPVVRTCLVVGTGLIGTSVALALRRHDVTVHLADRDPTAARQAAELGAGTLDPPAAQVDLAIVAVSPSATAEVVSGLLAGNVAATVVDTAAVKDGVLRAVAATVGPGPALRGHPPMAAARSPDPGAARADLFEGALGRGVAGAEPRSLARVHPC
jgi:hypothetical protein